MKKKTMLRMGLDIGMTILLFFCMSFQFMEQSNHEIFGTMLFVTFILHHFLNWRWYLNLGKGKYTSTRILSTTVDFVLLLDMFTLMFSGMRMSGYVFKWMDLNYSMEFARTLHMTASYGGFLVLGLHIGLHYGMILGMVGKLVGIRKKNVVRTWILRGIAILIGVYGIYALIQRRFLEYIFGKLHFVIFDYSEPVILFLLDLAAIMILMAEIGYYLQKLMAVSGKHHKAKE